MKPIIYRDTWAEIDLTAIKDNIRAMRHHLPETSDVMAVVKADGYGHGAVPIAKAAIAAGATSLAVALLEEALILREAGLTVPLLVFGRVAPEHVHIAAKNDITLTFYQVEWVKALKQSDLPRPLKVHLKLDTGMGRVGSRSYEELDGILEAITLTPDVELTGIYTHFASADDADLTYFHQQETKFTELLHYFKQKWDKPVCVHIGNSAAAMRFPKKMYDTIRFGIGMYGLYPSPTVAAESPLVLKQAFSLYSKLIHVKRIMPGDAVGYGSDYIASTAEWIGTIQIGYGDGWTRSLQGFSVLINGKRHPIVGRICMDQMMVRLDQHYDIDTLVTLIGSQGAEEISIDDVADYLTTINYEIPCLLNERIPRIYLDS